MKILAYLLYGNKREYKLELLFSIFSALKFLKNNDNELKISVITDQDDFDPRLPIDKILLSKDEFSTWTLNGTFNHRAKILALMKALDRYQVPVVFMDTDTFFIENPLKLFERVTPQTSVMHRFEFDQPIFALDYWRPIFDQIGEGIYIEEIHISPNSPMFNSGVIGVDVTHRWLLEKALVITDKLCAIEPLHTIEQFSLGLALNQHTKLLESEDIVKHYWCKMERGFINLQIARLLSDFSAPALDELLASPISHKVGYPPTFIQDRLATRIRAIGNKWDNDYKFAYLAYKSALSYSKKDMNYANQWSKIALHTIKCGISNKLDRRNLIICLTRLKHDFSRFSKRDLETMKWMEADVKRDWLEFWENINSQLSLA